MVQNPIGVFADNEVGNKTVKFLLKNYPEDLKYVVCVDSKSLIIKTLIDSGFDQSKIIIQAELSKDTLVEKLNLYSVNYIFLAWWPYIVKESVLSIPKIGVLNFHPSLLPYNRGKHYNFWTIVELSLIHI